MDGGFAMSMQMVHTDVREEPDQKKVRIPRETTAHATDIPMLELEAKMRLAEEMVKTFGKKSNDCVLSVLSDGTWSAKIVFTYEDKPTEIEADGVTQLEAAVALADAISDDERYKKVQATLNQEPSVGDGATKP